MAVDEVGCSHVEFCIRVRVQKMEDSVEFTQVVSDAVVQQRFCWEAEKSVCR